MSQAKVIAVLVEKGGVGKTTISVQLGRILSQNRKVLIVDNDASFDATSALLQDIPTEISTGKSPGATANTFKLYETDSIVHPVHITDNLHVIGASDALSLIAGIDSESVLLENFEWGINALRESYDLIIIDCPPSFGTHSIAAMRASDAILIPAVPEEFSFKASLKVIERVFHINKRKKVNLCLLGIVPNKVTSPAPKSVKYYLDEMASAFGPLLTKTIIQQTVKISDAISEHKNIDSSAKNSKAAEQFNSLADEVVARLENIDQLQIDFKNYLTQVEEA